VVVTVAVGSRRDAGGSVACGAGEPASQGEYVVGEFGWVEDLELGAKDGHVNGEHVG
jgi:hypothetical protein